MFVSPNLEIIDRHLWHYVGHRCDLDVGAMDPGVDQLPQHLPALEPGPAVGHNHTETLALALGSEEYSEQQGGAEIQ